MHNEKGPGKAPSEIKPIINNFEFSLRHLKSKPPPQCGCGLGDATFSLRRSARGFVVKFGEGDSIEVSERVLRSEQKFRHRVRAQLGKEFRARSQTHWSYELARAGNASGLSLDHWVPEEVRAREEAWFEEAYEKWLENWAAGP